MCFGGKSKSQPAPAPTQAKTIDVYEQDRQRRLALGDAQVAGTMTMEDQPKAANLTVLGSTSPKV